MRISRTLNYAFTLCTCPLKSPPINKLGNHGNDKHMTTFSCRPHCAACCIAPSITSPIPGMPEGKPAGVRCIQLSDDNNCLIFGQPERPKFCVSLQASEEMCGSNREQAIAWLNELENATAPSKSCN